MIVRELFARLGVKTDAASVKKADSAMAKLKKAAMGIGAALAARRVVLGLKNIIVETTAAADAVAKTSAKLGIGVQALQEYQYAAQIAGVPIRTFNMGLQRFTRRTAEAAQGTGEAKDALLQMGIQLKDTTTGRLRPAEDLLLDVADALAGTADEGEKVRLAFKLFDSEGVAMINMLKGGSKELIELRKRAVEAGGIFSGKFTKSAEEATNKLANQEAALMGLKAAITEKLLPAFDWFTDKTAAAYRWLARITEETHILEAALAVLGGLLVGIGVKFVVAFAAPIALGLALAVVLAIIVSALDDIMVSLEGGDSMGRRVSNMLGELYDNFMRLEDAHPVIKALLAPFQALLRALRLAKDSLFALVMVMTGEGGVAFDLLGEELEEDIDAKLEQVEDLKKKIEELPGGKRSVALLEKAGEQAGGAAEQTAGFLGKAGEQAGGILGGVGAFLRRAGEQAGIVSPTPAAGLMPTAGATQTSVSTTVNAPVTLNMETQPGQSPEEFGKAAATAVGKVFDEKVDDAAAETLPLRGG